MISNGAMAYTATDVSNANYLASEYIIKDWSGTPGNYRFDDNIARSEIMGMALAMAGITRNTNCRGDFADVPKSDIDWVCRTIETAADHGFINANPINGKIRPYASVSRAEAIAIFLKTFPNDGAWAGYSYYWSSSLPVDDSPTGYKDIYKFGAEWQASVFYEYIRKILHDDTQLRVNPRAGDIAIRKEVFGFAKKIMDYKVKYAELPRAHTVAVPFTAQAPTSNWDALHQDTCEEANAIMAHAYFTDHREANLDAEYVEKEITKLVNWEDTNLGYHKDTNAAETARMIRDVYGLQTKIVTDYTEEDLKKALNENKVIIYFAAGRLLGNPNYQTPGPLYHVLTIK